MLNKLVNSIIKPETNHGKYHRNGWGLLGAAYVSNMIHPALSVPLFIAAGYNFIQAYRYRSDIKTYFELKDKSDLEDKIN